MRGSQQVEETAADSLVFLHFTLNPIPELVRYRRSLAPCVLDHGVLVLLDRPALSTLRLAFRVARIPHHTTHPCMIQICTFFIVLFAFNLYFPKKEVYSCSRCKSNFHRSRLGPDGLCERCFTKICSQSDSFARQGRCIDAFDDGTVDPIDL